MKIAISGGGTGGHIYPALALIRTIKEQEPETEFLYIGTETGLESKLVRREGIPFETIDITGFKRSLSWENVKTVTRFIKGVGASRKILKRFKPDVVIGTGGYVCGPVVYAAAKASIPTIIHEQNSVPGLTNKFLSRYVDKVAICFESVRGFFPDNKVTFTGNPRASEVVRMHQQANIGKTLKSLGLDENKATALIVGGSRGARPINEAVLKALTTLGTKPYQTLYVTGEVHYDDVMKEASLIGELENVTIKPFIHNMQDVLAVVDVVAGRAGATSIAEITALGIPSILIPSPHVTNNHQEKNATSLTESGAAIMVRENELTSKRLVEVLDAILLDESKRKSMGEAARKLGTPDSSNRLHALMIELIENR